MNGYNAKRAALGHKTRRRSKTPPKLACMRKLKVAILIVLMLYLVPIVARALLLAFEDDRVPESHPDMSSIGLLPAPRDQPEPRILIMSAQMTGWKGEFLTHSWIVLKRENAPSWNRQEVLGWASVSDGSLENRWFGNSPVLNRFVPDGRWFGRIPVVIADIKGAEAAALIPKIEAAIEGYEDTAGHYRPWPGPNSNTFVAEILRAVPELDVTLPPTAVGKDFRPGPYFGLTDTWTGVEVSLLGVAGVKLGWVEGVEINFLSLIVGADLRQPALKLPGFGRAGLGEAKLSALSVPATRLSRRGTAATGNLDDRQR